jgi:hypothetical protein
VVLAVGSSLMGVSPFLSWVRVVIIGPLSLLQLLRIDGQPVGVLWVVVVVATVLGIGGFTTVAPTRALSVAGIITGAVVGLGGGPEIWHLVRVVSETDGLVTIAAGVYVASVGELLLLIGSLVLIAHPASRQAVPATSVQPGPQNAPITTARTADGRGEPLRVTDDAGWLPGSGRRPRAGVGSLPPLWRLAC